MISCLKKTVWFLILVFGSTSSGLAQSAFFEVASTPYDRQMLRVESTFAGPTGHSIDRLSFALVNEWMIKLRAMPYRYSREWRTPSEVVTARAADCKGKAIALYDRMQLNGATNLRLVIGKRRANDSLTHAWLEWDTDYGTLLLDPTFNWGATIKTSDPRSYIAFYGYTGPHKYQAGRPLLTNRVLATRNPAAPAHGVITRPMRAASPHRSTARVFHERPTAPSSFSYRSKFQAITRAEVSDEQFPPVHLPAAGTNFRRRLKR
jgi:hypothetical protein